MAVEPSKWPSILRTKELQEKIKSANVLCVGAGGIGCELLKTLVCTGFRNIEVVDLDTIETSNLNRQFLFRKHHVGQSKATTAAQVVKGFRPEASITAHHANMKESHFDVDFFRGFDVVLNGLDNLEARRHVNRLCLASERPLVESGTAGYLGQVTVHLKGRTECFECQPKPTPKSFPICTLRNTPDRPIHTIVWAKDLLFNRLFGRPDVVSDLDDQAEGQNAAARAGVGSAEDPSFFLRQDGEASLEYAERVFGRVYTSDIEQLCDVKELWEKRPPPKPLRLRELLTEEERAAVGAALEVARGAEGRGGGSASRALGLNNASQKWTPAQNAAVLLLAISMYHELRKEEVGAASFDKDDDLAVDFVTAASNLRSSSYGIPEQSLFDAKGMAGNIIHAIATTNAIISGLIVTEALKILAGCMDAARNTFLYEFPAHKRLLVVQHPDPPSRHCMVCGRATLTLRINTETTTLSALLSGVIKKRLAVTMPTLLCGGFMYEEGEGLEDDEVEHYTALLTRTLAALPGGGLRHGSILIVQDQVQHFGVDVVIAHADNLDGDEAPEGFLLEGDVPQAKEQQPQPQPQPRQQEGGADGTLAADGPGAVKRREVHVKEEDGVLILEEEEDGEAVSSGVGTAAAPAAAAAAAAAVAAAVAEAPLRKRPLDSKEDREAVIEEMEIEEMELVEPEAKRRKPSEPAGLAGTTTTTASTKCTTTTTNNDDDDDVIVIDDDD